MLGYRAASYSIGERNLWALDVLADCGYRYSSSVYPIRHDIYGMPSAPRFAFHAARGRLLEIPVTTTELFGRKWPGGGGGYFRLLPYAVSRWAVSASTSATASRRCSISIRGKSIPTSRASKPPAGARISVTT